MFDSVYLKKLQNLVFPRKGIKTPSVLQMEAVECGAAALAIVMGHYGKFVALEELRIECGVSRDGSKASNVLRAARRYGFEAKGYRREPQSLRDLKPPFIVFWNFNHFLVVEAFRGGKVYLNDPATGPRVIWNEEFDHSYTGVVLEIYPGNEFIPSGSPRNIFGALRKRVAGSELAVMYLFLVGLTLVLPGLVVPIFSKIFVDNYLVAHLDSWVKPLLLGMFVTAVMRGGLTWLKEYYLIRFETKLAISSSGKFLWHVLRLPVVFFSQRSAGDIGSRVAINDKVAQLLSRDLASSSLDLIMVVFFAALMFFYDVILTLVGLAVACLNIVVLNLVARKRKDANLKLQQDNGKLIGTSMNGLLVVETLKASGGESDFFAKWSGYQAKVVNGLQEMGTSSLVLNSTPAFLASLNTMLVLTLGGLRVMDGALTMGAVVALQSLMSSFLAPVNNLVGLGTRLQELDSDINRLDDVMMYEPEVGLTSDEGHEVVTKPHNTNAEYTEKTPVEDANVKAVKLEGYVELKGLTFGYSKLEEPLIKDFDLSLSPGSRVALVGHSGCGKSTISKLVMGLYKPWSGEILFDGISRSHLPRHVMINSVAMVDQEISMFEGSIRENLTMWDETIPESNLIRAAKDACVHDVISARAGGYDSLITEGGSNFSGGQKQRLEIARALVVNPRVLVLDEATSALDPVTEMKIDDNLRKRGCTLLIVAHRLSTIRDCDEIVVLQNGKVVERGTHDQLMNLKGMYTDLIHSH